MKGSFAQESGGLSLFSLGCLEGGDTLSIESSHPGSKAQDADIGARCSSFHGAQSWVGVSSPEPGTLAAEACSKREGFEDTLAKESHQHPKVPDCEPEFGSRSLYLHPATPNTRQ